MTYLLLSLRFHRFQFVFIRFTTDHEQRVKNLDEIKALSLSGKALTGSTSGNALRPSPSRSVPSTTRPTSTSSPTSTSRFLQSTYTRTRTMSTTTPIIRATRTGSLLTTPSRDLRGWPSEGLQVGRSFRPPWQPMQPQPPRPIMSNKSGIVS